MKKMIIFTLALTLALILSACGNSDNGGGSATTPPANSSTPETSQGGNDTAPSNNGGGNAAGWAKFPLGKLIPEPEEWPFNPTTNTEEQFQIAIGWEREEAAAYAERCRAAGFDVGVETEDKADLYYYTARNNDGIKVTVSYGSSMNIEVSIASGWTEFTLGSLIPEPDVLWSDSDVSADDDIEFRIRMAWGREEAARYVEAVKAADFDQNIDTDDADDGFYYTAENSDGIRIRIDLSAIEVTAP
jgi:hypothetical protein